MPISSGPTNHGDDDESLAMNLDDVPIKKSQEGDLDESPDVGSRGEHNSQRESIQTSPTTANEELSRAFTESRSPIRKPDNQQEQGSHAVAVRRPRPATTSSRIIRKRGLRRNLDTIGRGFRPPLIKGGLRRKQVAQRESEPRSSSSTKRGLRRKHVVQFAQRESESRSPSIERGFRPPLIKGGLRRKQVAHVAQRESEPRSPSSTKRGLHRSVSEALAGVQNILGFGPRDGQQVSGASPQEYDDQIRNERIKLGLGRHLAFAREDPVNRRSLRANAGVGLNDGQTRNQRIKLGLGRHLAFAREDPVYRRSLEANIQPNDESSESEYSLENSMGEADTPEGDVGSPSEDNREEFFPGAVFVRTGDDQSDRSEHSTSIPLPGDQVGPEVGGYDIPSAPQTPVPEAIPVESNDDDLEIGEAHEVDPEELQRAEEKLRKARECRRCGMVLIGLSTLVMVLAVVFSREDPIIVFETPSPTAPQKESSIAPSATPTLITENLPLLETLHLNASKEFNLAQLAALNWLDAHPQFSTMDAWRQQQLFALAAFYYSMDGRSWPSTVKDWMRSYKDECDWYSYSYLWTDYYAELEGVEYIPSERRDPNASICTDHGRYTYLGLTGVNGIAGTVPPEVPRRRYTKPACPLQLPQVSGS